MGTGNCFPGDKAAGAWDWPLNLHVVSRLKLSGAVPPLSSMTSWYAQGQLSLYLFSFTQQYMRGALPCASPLSDRFCIGSCTRTRVQCHLFGASCEIYAPTEGRWQSCMAGHPCTSKTADGCSCWQGKTTLNDVAPRKYSAFLIEIRSSGKSWLTTPGFV